MQGVGGAVVSAVAFSLIMVLFTEPAERAKAMGVFGFVMAGGGSIGVLLGGVLTNSLDWHWIFLVNIPIGVLVVALSLRLLPTTAVARVTGRVDVAGAITVTAALILAVYAIVNGNQSGWSSAQTLGLLGAAVVLLAVFLLIESRVAEPLMPLALFRLRNVATANVVGCALGCRDVRLVLPLGALPAARARLHAAAGRARLPACQPDHGRVLDRPVGEARDAVRDSAAAGCGVAPRRGRARPVRARPGRRAASSSTCCRA